MLGGVMSGVALFYHFLKLKIVKIKSKKTGLVPNNVTAEDWDKMKGRGDAKNFDIISSDDDPKIDEKPSDLSDKNYQDILKTATKNFKDGKLERAKKGFLKAQAIKDTDLIKEKLAEIEVAQNPENPNGGE